MPYYTSERDGGTCSACGARVPVACRQTHDDWHKWLITSGAAIGRLERITEDTRRELHKTNANVNQARSVQQAGELGEHIQILSRRIDGKADADKMKIHLDGLERAIARATKTVAEWQQEREKDIEKRPDSIADIASEIDGQRFRQYPGVYLDSAMEDWANRLRNLS